MKTSLATQVDCVRVLRERRACAAIGLDRGKADLLALQLEAVLATLTWLKVREELIKSLLEEHTRAERMCREFLLAFHGLSAEAIEQGCGAAVLDVVTACRAHFGVSAGGVPA